MFAGVRQLMLWLGLAAVLILPALGGGNSLIEGWPQATLFLTLALAFQVTDPNRLKRLPWWYFALGAGLAVLGAIWLYPGPALLALSPTRAAWPGPDGTVSGVAADRIDTWEALFQALGFWSTLGLALIAGGSQNTRRWLMRCMLACIVLVVMSALTVQFLHLPVNLLPDVTVLFTDRLAHPFTGPNVAAAFFVSSLGFSIGVMFIFSDEERYLPRRHMWQIFGIMVSLALLGLQLMTQNRWMWLCLAVVGTAVGSVYLWRNRKTLSGRDRRTRPVERRSRRARFHRRLRLWLMLAGGVLGMIVFLALFHPQAVIERFVLLTGGQEQEVSRPLIWLNAWHTFLEYRWVGTGLGGFGEVCPTTAPAGIHMWPRFAHCEPLQWLAETGLAGVALALVVGGGMVRDALRIYREQRDTVPDRLPFFASAGLLMMAGLIDFPFRCPSLLFLMALYVGVCLARDGGSIRSTGAAAAPTPTPAAGGAMPAPGPGAAQPAWREPRVWCGAALALALVALTGVYVPTTWRLTARGAAMWHYQSARRNFTDTKDPVALEAAAQTLFEETGRDPRWSAEALNTMMLTATNGSRLTPWLPAIDEVLTDCPYRDNMYFFKALAAFENKDYDRAERLNTIARCCAATNNITQQMIVNLDFALAAVADDPVRRHALLRHAQATMRWFLSNQPNGLVSTAAFAFSRGITLNELLPGLPADFDNTHQLCAVCLFGDRPLTLRAIFAAHPLYTEAVADAAATDRPAPLPSESDLVELTCIGDASKAQAMILAGFETGPVSYRAGLLSMALNAGWGVLSVKQWDQVVDTVENSLPDAAQRYQLGRLYYLRGQLSNAREQWLKSFKASPSPQACAALARMYATLQIWSVAGDYAEEWTRIDSKNPNAWNMMAIAAYYAKDYRSAKIAFARFRALAPAQAAEEFRLGSNILAGLAADQTQPNDDPLQPLGGSRQKKSKFDYP
ncbi:MAG: O-antigen ligase family protein [Planctomycetota bacterium]